MAAATLALERIPFTDDPGDVLFAGGVRGVVALGVLFALGGLVLAVDLAGQGDRTGARSLMETRPASAFALQGSRLLALAAAILPLAAVPVITRGLVILLWDGERFLLPALAVSLCVLVPLGLAGLCSGLAARSASHTDPGGVLLAGLVVAPVVWQRLAASEPGDIILLSAPAFGLLTPAETLLRDALPALGLSLAAAGAALLTARRVMPPTPLRRVDPPAMSRLPGFRRAFGSLRRQFRENGVLLPVALAVVLGGGALWAPAAVALWNRTAGSDPLAYEADWASMTEPPGAVNGTVFPPDIRGRSVRFEPADPLPLMVTLDLASALSQDQPVAALTFGPGMVPESIERKSGSVALRPRAASPGMHALVLAFDPPLSPDQAEAVTFRFPPPEGEAARGWRRLYHPRFATFEDLPNWFGTGMLIRYSFAEFAVAEQPAPFVLDLPDPKDSRWICPPAGEAESASGRVRLSRGTAALPEPLFAANLVRVPPAEDALVPVDFYVFPEHARAAEVLQTLSEPWFRRLGRAFGAPEEPLTYAEVPSVAAGSAWEIPSPALDALARTLEAEDRQEAAIRAEAAVLYLRLQPAAIERLFAGAFSGFEYPELLRDAWAGYLHETGFAGGRFVRYEDRRRDFVLVPWEWVRGRDEYPLDLLEREVSGWEGPAFAAMRSPTAAAVPPERLRAFHHMLRGLLGDDATVEMMRRLVAERGGEVLRLEDVRQAAEEISGLQLQGFFDQWLREGIVPRLRLREADVVLTENPDTRDFEYRTRVVLANEGTGLVPVTVRLETEQDTAEKLVEAPAGEAVTVTFVTPDRPVEVVLDPEGWVASVPRFDERAGRPGHPRLFLRTVREL